MLLPVAPPSELAVAHAETDASEVAVYIAREVLDPAELDEREVKDLLKLTTYLICTREHSSARLRLGHLGLLIELTETTTTGYVRRRDYDLANADGEHPNSSTLARYYGGWVKAVRAATNWLTRGGQARTKVNHRDCFFHASYDVQEIRAAILRCRLDIGDWPREWEWEEWAAIVRRLARRDPRLPVMKAIRLAYGDFDTAVDDTRRAWARSDAARRRAMSHGASARNEAGSR